MNVRSALDRLYSALIIDVAKQFGMSECVVEPSFATRAGSWNGRDLLLSTRIFEGAGPIRSLRLARVTGAMESLTVVGLCNGGAPTLGLDLVAFATKGADEPSFATVVMDLTPHGRALSKDTRELLVGTRAEAVQFGEERPWSDAAPCPFSELGFIVKPTDPAPQRWLSLGLTMVRAFATEARSQAAHALDEGPSSTLPSAHVQYLSSLAESKKQMRALGTLFGEAWVVEYFDRIYFGASTSSRPKSSAPASMPRPVPGV